MTTVKYRLQQLIEFETINDYSAEELVKEYFNCKEAIVDSDGIWIENPQTGHYVDDDSLVNFLDWVGA